MSKPILVSLNECPIGDVIHDPHTWRQGFFLIKHGCMGHSEKHYTMMRLLEAGSAGTLTQEQIDEYLSKYGR